jgi:ketosteroid isomerase-like protein
MNTQDQLDAIKALHGSAAGLLSRQNLFELLAEDVEWYVLGSPDILPWAGVYRGPAEVRGWFNRLSEHLQYEQFEPVEFIAQTDTVVEVIRAIGRAKATGRPFQSDVVRIWNFRGHRVVHVRSYYDTANYLAAFRDS